MSNQSMMVFRGTPPDDLNAKELLVRRFFLDGGPVWIHVYRNSVYGAWRDSNAEVVPMGRVEGWMHVPD